MAEKGYKYKVCNRCFTYNQAPFIVATMEGFVMQETSFPVYSIIMDDASTDGEPEVILRYIDDNFEKPYRTEETDDYFLKCARHRTNKNCIFIVVLLKYNHYSIRKNKFKYISEWFDNAEYHSVCEGDDYWTVCNKLQTQVEFLDKHSNYSMHCTNAMVINRNGDEVGLFSDKESRDITSLDEMVIKRQFHFASIVYRSSFIDDPHKYWDTYLTCDLATKGPIRYDNRVTCIYRKAGQGVTNTTPSLKWIELNERWSNILYKAFYPKYLSHEGAYLSLSQDILNQLINNNQLSKEERKGLKRKYREYASFSIRVKNIGFVCSMYRNRCILACRKLFGKEFA